MKEKLHRIFSEEDPKPLDPRDSVNQLPIESFTSEAFVEGPKTQEINPPEDNYVTEDVDADLREVRAIVDKLPLFAKSALIFEMLSDVKGNEEILDEVSINWIATKVREDFLNVAFKILQEREAQNHDMLEEVYTIIRSLPITVILNIVKSTVEEAPDFVARMLFENERGIDIIAGRLKLMLADFSPAGVKLILNELMKKIDSEEN